MNDADIVLALASLAEHAEDRKRAAHLVLPARELAARLREKEPLMSASGATEHTQFEGDR